MNLDFKLKQTNPNHSILGLKQPVICLAPMDGVSDSPFRQITKKYGDPDLIFTEFTHVMGLCMAAENTLNHFYYEEMERPVIAQIYGQEPEYFYHAAKIVVALGFDGVDINMGCPAKKVTASGSGAALIKTPELAKEIVLEVKRGVADWVENGKLTGLKPKAKKAVEDLRNKFIKRVEESDQTKFTSDSNILGIKNLSSDERFIIPTSVKTRIGFDKPVTEWWIKKLSKVRPEWISIHGRTLKQMYSGGADWEELKIAVDSTDIPVMTNGDIKEYGDIYKMLEKTRAAGVLIGRGAFGNPWIFSSSNKQAMTSSSEERQEEYISKDERLKVMIEHARIFDDLHEGSDRAFVQMRKHFGWYVKNFDNAKELRSKLVRVRTYKDLINKLNN